MCAYKYSYGMIKHKYGLRFHCKAHIEPIKVFTAYSPLIPF